MSLLMQSSSIQFRFRLRSHTRQKFLNFSNSTTRIQTLRTSACAVHDGVTSVNTEGILKFTQTFSGVFITGINDPTISLHENSGTQVFISIPPVRGTRGGAASTQDAFIQTIQFRTVLNGLQVLSFTLLLNSFVSARLDGFFLVNFYFFWLI